MIGRCNLYDLFYHPSDKLVQWSIPFIGVAIPDYSK
jgi:hypothetical protein